MILGEVSFDGFLNVFVILAGLIGIGLIVLGIYLKIKDSKFKKEAVIVKFLVKKVEKVSDKDEEGEIVRGYHTTFEFEYEGKTKEYTMITSKKFKEGSTKEGLYLLKDGKETVSISGEGFHLAKGGALALIVFGITVVLIMSYVLFKFSAWTLIYCLVFLFALLGLLVIRPFSFSKKNKTGKDKVYYDDEANQYSSVNPNLTRYIPEASGKGIDVGAIILSIFLFAMGTVFFVIGINFATDAKKIKNEYEKVEGKIINISERPGRNTDGNKTTYIDLTYQYEVDGITYTIDESGGEKSELSTYEIGDTTTIYYDKNDPNVAVTSKSLSSVGPLGGGLLFMLSGIYIFANYMKKRKLYKLYLKSSEGK